MSTRRRSLTRTRRTAGLPNADHRDSDARGPSRRSQKTPAPAADVQRRPSASGTSRARRRPRCVPARAASRPASARPRRRRSGRPVRAAQLSRARTQRAPPRRRASARDAPRHAAARRGRENRRRARETAALSVSASGCHCRAELALECSSTTAGARFRRMYLPYCATCATIGASAAPMRSICAGVDQRLQHLGEARLLRAADDVLPAVGAQQRRPRSSAASTAEYVVPALLHEVIGVRRRPAPARCRRPRRRARSGR